MFDYTKHYRELAASLDMAPSPTLTETAVDIALFADCALTVKQLDLVKDLLRSFGDQHVEITILTHHRVVSMEDA